MEHQGMAEREDKVLSALLELEDLAEKKAKIYSRLLTEVTMAQNMEKLAMRHEQRKESIEKLLYGKPLKKKNGQGMSSTNGKE
jgi:hypothetical protein